jgi:hypothetical protein
LSSLAVASDEQYESILDDEIALLARKFCSLHQFHKERRWSHRWCFECGDTIHFIIDCPKRKKLDSQASTTTTTITGMTPNNNGDNKKSTASGARRSFKRSCPEHVLP